VTGAWFWWMLIALLVLLQAGQILIIDIPRDPLTRGQVLFNLACNAGLILGILKYGLHW
jgi:hypothetical protein